MDLPYFETFYRWNSETNVRSINVDSTVETVTVFLKFQISNTIDGLYSFEQVFYIY